MSKWVLQDVFKYRQWYSSEVFDNVSLLQFCEGGHCHLRGCRLIWSLLMSSGERSIVDLLNFFEIAAWFHGLQAFLTLASMLVL